MEALHPRDGAPPRGGQAARPPLGRLVLRLARRHRGRQAARGARPHRPRRPRRARQRARRLPGVPARSSRASASPKLRDAGLPGPAPAVGVDRRQEPAVPRDALRLRPGRPAHRQHDAAADAAGRRASDGEITGATAAEDPTRRPRRAARGRHRPRRRHRQAAARRHRRVPGPDGQAARRHRAQARGDRHRPPGGDRGRPAGRARAAARRSASSARRRGRRAPHLAARRHAVGARGHARGDQPPRLADDRREAARGRSTTLDGLRRGGARRRATPTRCCSAWAARASRPRSSAARYGPREGGLRLHVLDSTDPDADRGASRDALDLDKTLFIVSSKSGGTIETMSQFKYFHALPAATARTSSRSPTRARACSKLARRARLPARVRERPGHRRALLARCRTSGSCPAALAGVDVARRARGRARWPTQDCRARARATPACGSACALGELARAGPRQADVRRRRAARRRSACGPSSSSPSRPASRAAASCRSPTSRSPTPAPTATTACSCTSRTDDAGRRARSRRSLHCQGRPPGDHRATPTGPTTSGGSSSSPSSRPRSPAGCWRSTRSTSPTCRRPRTTRSACSRRARRSSRTGDLDALLDGLEPPRYLAIMGYLPYSERGRGGGRAPARAR